MTTMLENYVSLKSKLITSINESSCSLIWPYQEILYRIEVLEACQMYCKCAPENADPKTLSLHYRMFDSYIQNLMRERRYGVAPDEAKKKQRETAHSNLCLVVKDYRKRFGSFAPGTDQYKKEISKAISTVLPVWIQYRETYIEVNQEVL